MSVKRTRKQPEQRPVSKPGNWGDVPIYAALTIAIAAIYARLAGYDFINYDDPAYVADNPHIRNGLTADGLAWAFTSAHDSNWIPLTWISHMLDCQLFGLQSGLHHLTSVVIHTMSSLLLFAVMKRITNARWPSAFVAFVFAVHPLHVESVAWIAERKDVLCAFFSILTLGAYARFTTRRSTAGYALVVAMFCCALLSKPMAVTLPLGLLLLDWWPLKRFSRDAVLEKIPLAVISVVAMVVAFVAQKRSGAVAEFEAAPLGLRVENALVAYAVYLWKLIAPANLAVIYPYPSAIPWWQWMAAGLVICAISAAVWKARASRPYLAVGWLWYLVTLGPVIGLIQIGVQARADRYTYVPMIGISILLAWGAAEFYDRAKPLVIAAGLIACTAWLGVAWIDAGYWANSVSLFQRAIEVTDGNYVAYNNLATALRHEGRIREAVSLFETAARMRPDDAQIRDNLGEALTTSGQIADAMVQLQQAVRLRPEWAKAHIDFGSALLHTGRTEEAASEYRTALRIEPNRVDAQYGLGGVLAAQGRLEEARPLLQAALPSLTDQARLKPEDADTHFNLGLVYEFLGRGDEAIVEFSSVVRLQPDDADGHFNLGVALAERNRMDDAFGELATAVRLRPDDGRARFRLAEVLYQLGRRLEALAQLTELVKRNPGYPGARAAYETMYKNVYGN